DPFGAERLVGVQQEEGQERVLLAAPKREEPALVESLQRTEDAEVHDGGGRRGATERTSAPDPPQPAAARHCYHAFAALLPAPRTMPPPQPTGAGADRPPRQGGSDEYP